MVALLQFEADPLPPWLRVGRRSVGMAAYLDLHLRDFHLQIKTFGTTGELCGPQRNPQMQRRCYDLRPQRFVHFSVHRNRAPEYHLDSDRKNDVKNSVKGSYLTKATNGKKNGDSAPLRNY